MNFLYPIYLYGLFAISIPIIIHLFNFRRHRKIYFPNVKFLEEVKQKTKRKSNIKHLLVLISRILAITALVLAFAQPYIPIDNKIVNKGKNLVCVYLDNSFSMAAESDKGILLDAGKNLAREIINSYAVTDEFCFINNNFEGKHQRILNKEDVDENVINTELTPSIRKISEIASRFEGISAESDAENVSLYLISDFQKSICDFPEFQNDTLKRTFLLPLTSVQQENIYIDSCWFESPVQLNGQQTKLMAKITNTSDASFDQYPVKLFFGEQQAALATVALGPKSSTIAELHFTIDRTGIFDGLVEIKDHPISYDDKFYLNFKVNEKISIYSIYEETTNKYLNSLFGSDSLFEFQNIHINSIDFGAFSKQNLIILNGIEQFSSGLVSEIKKYLENGGSLAIFPSINANIESYNSFLKEINIPKLTAIDTTDTEVIHVNLQHELYNDVFEEIPENMDLPKIKQHYKIQRQTYSQHQNLITMLNGNSMLISKEYITGKIYLSSVPLDVSYSNFPEHAIFVPTLYKIAFLSNSMPPLYYNLGEENLIPINNIISGPENIYKITKKPNFEIIPASRTINNKTNIYLSYEIKDAGNYNLQLEGKTIDGIALNYQRSESNVDFHSTDEMQEIIEQNNLNQIKIIDSFSKPLSQTIKKLDEGTPLWKWFIIGCLLFLLTEIATLRLL